jgi:hypothetical protein
MRYFPVVLVTFRFIAVLVVALAIYRLTSTLAGSSAPFVGHDFVDAMNRVRAEAIKGGVLLGGYGVLLYLVSPVLAALVTRGCPDNRSSHER